jgi:hypothetical protein
MTEKETERERENERNKNGESWCTGMQKKASFKFRTVTRDPVGFDLVVYVG